VAGAPDLRGLWKTLRAERAGAATSPDVGSEGILPHDRMRREEGL